MNKRINTVHNARFTTDHPQFKAFARNCDLPPRTTYLEMTHVVMSRLARFSVVVQFCEARALVEEHGLGIESWVCGDLHTDAFVIKHAYERHYPQWVAVGAILQSYGMFVEQLASGSGYKKGRDALRGTSFDAARQLLERMPLRYPHQFDISKAANLLVGFLNGIWLARLFGFDPRHVASRVMITAGENEVLATYLLCGNAVVGAVTQDASIWLEETLRVESEHDLCASIDAKTLQLLRDETQNFAIGSKA